MEKKEIIWTEIPNRNTSIGTIKNYMFIIDTIVSCTERDIFFIYWKNMELSMPFIFLKEENNSKSAKEYCLEYYTYICKNIKNEDGELKKKLENIYEDIDNKLKTFSDKINDLNDRIFRAENRFKKYDFSFML